MSEDRNLLARWSRRKREAARVADKPAEKPAAQPADAPAAKPPELPPIDSLNLDSDFTAYLAANVEESVKRAALKKLFSDPRFNVMDGLDVYIDDYTKNDPIPDEMLKRLEHVRSTLQGLEPPAQEQPKVDTAEAPVAPMEESEPTRGNPEQDA